MNPGLFDGYVQAATDPSSLRVHILKIVVVFKNVIARFLSPNAASVPPPIRRSVTWVPPGHFYSPLVDPDDRHVARILDNLEASILPPDTGVILDDERILATLNRISCNYPEMPFSDQKIRGLRYHFRNGAFEQGDGTVYFCMLRDISPKRVIEVGSGFSSCLIMDTNDRFFNRGIEVKFIEPYPETFNRLTVGDSYYRERLICSPIQDVPTSVFQTLTAGDILFIDSTHVGKMGSDVNDYLFRILPRLAAGVLIHIHDIPYPFEYPSDWIRKENRSWNEAYLLRAFLQFNPVFRVIYFNHYVYKVHRDLLAEKMPKCLENPGASIWIEKTI